MNDLTPCSIDIASALVRHSSPRFPPPTELLPALVPPQPSRDDVARFGRLTSTWVQTFPDLVDVVDALRNLKALSTVIDGEHASRGEQLWYDEIFIGFRANPVAHRLLTASYAEDAVHPRLRIREASRLAALLTIVYLKMKCSSYPAQLPAWYATQILAAMNDEQMSLPEFAPLKLWMLLICGIVSSGDQRLAVTSIMVDSIRTLMLSSWVEAMDQIKLMPWMDSLLGIAGGYFGQEVTAALE